MTYPAPAEPPASPASSTRTSNAIIQAPARSRVGAHTGAHEALVAAARAGLGTPKTGASVEGAAKTLPPPLTPRNTTPVAPENRFPPGKYGLQEAVTPERPTGPQVGRHSPSPSRIAASMAVAKSAKSRPSRGLPDLVQLFEGKNNADHDSKDGEVPHAAVSPVPTRPAFIGRSSTQKDRARTSPGTLVTPAKKPPEIPPPRKASAAVSVASPQGSTALSRHDLKNSSGGFTAPSHSNTASQGQPAAPRVQTSPSAQTVSTPPSTRPAPHPAAARRSPSAHPSLYPMPSSRPQLTADSLANAIVAGSLATSRAPSPSKPGSGPQPSPARRSKATSFSVLLPSGTARTPSPTKQTILRTTLRSGHDSTDEDDQGRKKGRTRAKTIGHHNMLIKKHPHKHHEADRRRWLDEITDKERKRYEGVWAANRGILMPAPATSPAMAPALRPPVLDEVHSLVVKDIWSRSGLAPAALERVWELVDGGGLGKERGRGSLGREEFVVGLWLVDQCLKGRKLPLAVQPSVWASVRLLGGVTFRR